MFNLGVKICSQHAKLNCGSIHVKTGNQFKINSNPHLQIVV